MADNTMSLAPTSTSTHEKPSEIATVLAKVDALLRANDAQQALTLLGRTRLESPWLRNAVGVCQMRLGQAHAAVGNFRALVVSDTLLLRHDVPAVFKANYATALLLDKNMSGCIAALAELRIGEHPAVAKVQTAIQRWKSQLTVWQKIKYYTGSELDDPVHLDFPPGDLE